MFLRGANSSSSSRNFPQTCVRVFVLQTQYDILASELRKHLDMKKIYEILEKGVEDILEESEAEGEAEK